MTVAALQNIAVLIVGQGSLACWACQDFDEIAVQHNTVILPKS